MMALHKAILRSLEMDVNGTMVEVINPLTCNVGQAWLVDTSHKLSPQRMWCGTMKEYVEAVQVVYAMHADKQDEGGLLPACLFEIDEEPLLETTHDL